MAETPGLKIRFDSESRYELEALAKKLRITRSAVVRRAIAEMAKRQKIAPMEGDREG